MECGAERGKSREPAVNGRGRKLAFVYGALGDTGVSYSGIPILNSYSIGSCVLFDVSGAPFKHNTLNIAFVRQSKGRVERESALAEGTAPPRECREYFVDETVTQEQESASSLVMSRKSGGMFVTAGTSIKITCKRAIFDRFGIAVDFFEHVSYHQDDFYLVWRADPGPPYLYSSPWGPLHCIPKGHA